MQVKTTAILLLCCVLVQGHAKDLGAPMQLELPDADGSRFVRLSDFAARPLVLNFWRSDCPPCLQEMPLLQQAARRYTDAQFLGIAAQDPLAAHRFLIRQAPMAYPQLLAPLETSGIMRRFGNVAGALPYTVVLDVRHQMCRTHVGAVDAAWLETALAVCAPSRQTAN